MIHTTELGSTSISLTSRLSLQQTIAVHEAGHALIHKLLGGRNGFLTLIGDEPKFWGGGVHAGLVGMGGLAATLLLEQLGVEFADNPHIGASGDLVAVSDIARSYGEDPKRIQLFLAHAAQLLADNLDTLIAVADGALHSSGLNTPQLCTIFKTAGVRALRPVPDLDMDGDFSVFNLFRFKDGVIEGASAWIDELQWFAEFFK